MGKNINPIKVILIYLIKSYRYAISPLLGQKCRFYPSCSQYTLESLQKYGLVKGLYLSSKRLLKCHPWGQSGFDPVP